MSLTAMAGAVLGLVTAVVTAWRWEPRAVWSMEVWELVHWSRVAGGKPDGT